MLGREKVIGSSGSQTKAGSRIGLRVEELYADL